MFLNIPTHHKLPVKKAKPSKLWLELHGAAPVKMLVAQQNGSVK
jgi:hypothetical protein